MKTAAVIPRWASALVWWVGVPLVHGASLFGSVPVLAGGLCLWAAMSVAAVPWEERVLEERFGESYRAYKRSVPRWLGRARR